MRPTFTTTLESRHSVEGFRPSVPQQGECSRIRRTYGGRKARAPERVRDPFKGGRLEQQLPMKPIRSITDRRERGPRLWSRGRTGLFAAVAFTLAWLFHFAALDVSRRDVTVFILLSACAAVAQGLSSPTSQDHPYFTSLVFLAAGALLLPPTLVALMGVATYMSPWTPPRPLRTLLFETWSAASKIARACIRVISG